MRTCASSLAAVCAFALMVSPLAAQASEPAEPANLNAEFTEIKEQLKALSQKLDQIEKRLPERREKEVEGVDKRDKRLEQLEIEVAQLSDRFDKFLKGEIPPSTELIRRLTPKPGDGQGKLWINNFTGRETRLYINGGLWRALKNRSYVYVPLGKVAIKRWDAKKSKFVKSESWERKNGEWVATYDLVAD